MPASVHKPVLYQEVLNWANLSSVKIFIDGTLGGGGHSSLVATRLSPNGKIVGFDRDSEAIERTRPGLQAICDSQNITLKLVHDSYVGLPERLKELEIEQADCILLDLGISSDQLDAPGRGFSFRHEGPLDFRFDTTRGITAAEFIARSSENELAEVLHTFGEERFSRRIANAIVQHRSQREISTTFELAEIIRSAVPGKTHGRVDSATRSFQALRIAVNEELVHVAKALDVLPDCLKPGGRLLVISFHSLEDRLVKNAFQNSELLHSLHSKPITAGPTELTKNPRSRSAKLRIAERIQTD